MDYSNCSIGENNRSILIVDDAAVSRIQLKRIFSSEYTVFVAENGQLAMDILNSGTEMTAVVLDIMMPVMNGYEVLDEMQRNDRLKRIPVIVVTASSDEETQIKAIDHGAQDVITKPINPKVIQHRVANIIGRMDAIRLENENKLYEQRLQISETDAKTGLYNKQAFCFRTSEYIKANQDNKYVICRWDVDNFKVYNDIIGVEAGDEFLKTIADEIKKRKIKGLVTAGHMEDDHFVICVEWNAFYGQGVAEKIVEHIRGYSDSFDLIARVGIFEINDVNLDVSLMCDRAFLALRSIKYSYSEHIASYNESMRRALLEEQELINNMEYALSTGEFVPYYQPQYNYSTNKLIGAEVLVRWNHPKKGLILPDTFIPLFERNGFITKLDEYIWGQACADIRGWLDMGIEVPPVAVNISRIDIYNTKLPEIMQNLLSRYGIEASMLRLEVTESAYMDAPDQLISAVQRLEKMGFVVEMDDFGSGYSSLNTLKEVPVDVLKMDMKFLEAGKNDRRSGRILSSVLRMANWIDLPVLAEGVETKQQADYLVSMGCIRMQGYYFARPMPKIKYEQLLSCSDLSYKTDKRHDEYLEGSIDFLDASTQATQLFNSFIGGAQIMEYDGTTLTSLRVNDSFLEMMGITREEYTPIMPNILERFDEDSRDRLIAALNEAIETGNVTSCELCSRPFHNEAVPRWTLNKIRVLSRRENRSILYFLIENINERKQLSEVQERMEDISHNLPVGIGIFELGEQLRPVYLSEKACLLFGFTQQEYEDRIANDEPLHFSPDIRDITEESLKEYETNPLNMSFLAKKKDNSRFWLRTIASVAYRKEHDPLIYAALMDVTDEKIKDETRL